MFLYTKYFLSNTATALTHMKSIFLQNTNLGWVGRCVWHVTKIKYVYFRYIEYVQNPLILTVNIGLVTLE